MMNLLRMVLLSKSYLMVLMKLESWKNIRIIQKEDVYYFYKLISMAIPFMYYGEFPKDMTNQLC